jgi:hypothetical protein
VGAVDLQYHVLHDHHGVLSDVILLRCVCRDPMNCEFMICLSMNIIWILNSYMHDCDSLVFLLRSISLVWLTIFFILQWEEVLGNGFNLVVLNPSDKKGHDTHVLLLLRIKRWGLFMPEFILSTSCHLA